MVVPFSMAGERRIFRGGGVLIPGAEVMLGSMRGNSDEQPVHRVELQSFLMDQEPVSASAYCRFLNSIGEVDHCSKVSLRKKFGWEFFARLA